MKPTVYEQLQARMQFWQRIVVIAGIATLASQVFMGLLWICDIAFFEVLLTTPDKMRVFACAAVPFIVFTFAVYKRESCRILITNL